jgi:hypothetical protein
MTESLGDQKGGGKSGGAHCIGVSMTVEGAKNLKKAAFGLKSFPILAPFACAVDFLPEQHPNGALSRRAKCVAAVVNLVPRRKKSVDILTKSEGILVKIEGVLTKSKGIPTLFRHNFVNSDNSVKNTLSGERLAQNHG